jgi:hypothetical protein
MYVRANSDGTTDILADNGLVLERDVHVEVRVLSVQDLVTALTVVKHLKGSTEQVQTAK